MTGRPTDSIWSVGSGSLPPWDRTGGKTIDLSPRLGSHVATGPKTAARLLATKLEGIRKFVAPGIIREARIVDRPFVPGVAAFVCVSPRTWSRIFLRWDETLIDLSFDDPDHWRWTIGETDVEGRSCILVQPMHELRSADVTITTDRRVYRVNLVAHPSKVTIGFSWTYPEDAEDKRARAAAGEMRPRYPSSRDKERPTRFVLFELGKSLQEHVLEWEADLKPRNAWELDLHKRIRRQAGVRADVPLPAEVTKAVLEKLLEVGTISLPEIRQWVKIRDPGSVVDQFTTLARLPRTRHLRLPGGAAPTQADLLSAFPFLNGLSETSFADEESYPAASERALRLVWMLGDLSPTGALFAAVAPRFLRRPDVIEQVLRRALQVEHIASAAGIAVDLANAGQLDQIIDHVLSKPDGELSGSARHDLCRAILLLTNTLRRYFRMQGTNVSAGLEHLRPAIPSGPVRDRLNALTRKVVQAHRRSRKARVFRHAGHLGDLEFAADINLEQLVMTTRALKDAERDIGTSDWIDVPVQTTIVDQHGRLVPGRQTCIWRVWSLPAYIQRLSGATDVRSETAFLTRALHLALEAGDRAYVHEFRSVRGMLGGPAIEPFFVRCWRYGLLSPPALLPARVRHKRRMLLRQLKLPGDPGIQRSGLLMGTDTEMDLWRVSLRQHRVIAFLEPREHALRFAHFALSSTTENLARHTAWVQQVQDQSGWAVHSLNSVKTAGYLAHDKQTAAEDLTEDMTWFPVSAGHLRKASELAAMTCRRAGYIDGLLPRIKQERTVFWKRRDAQPWYFSYGGSILQLSYLHRYLRFLLPSYGRITYHDLRHLGANAALEAGVPGWVIRMTLNHGFTGLWEYYSELTSRQLKAFGEGHIQTRMKRGADARSAMARI